MSRWSFLVIGCVLVSGCGSNVVSREHILGKWSTVPLDQPEEFTYLFLESGEVRLAGAGWHADGALAEWRLRRGKWRLEGNTLTMDFREGAAKEGAGFKLDREVQVFELVRVNDSRLEYRTPDEDRVVILFRKND